MQRTANPSRRVRLPPAPPFPLVPAAALAALLASLPATATPLPGAESLDEIQVTAHRRSEPAAAVPHWVTTVSEEEIDARRPQVLAEALRGQPGAWFQQTGPGQGIVIVRGLKGAEILHLVDGMRLNNAFFRTAPSQYIALVDPNNLGRVELLRGAAAGTYGSDAMGGVLQVLTPEERFDSATWDLRGKARLAYGTGEASRVARLSTAAGREGLSIAVGASYLDYGNRRVGGLGQVADGSGGITLAERAGPTGYEARAQDAKVLWSPAEGHELMLSGQWFSAPGLPRYNEMVPGYGTASAGLPDTALSTYDNARQFTHLRYRAALGTGVLRDLELHAARQVVVDDRFDRSLDLATDAFEQNRSTLDGYTLRLGLVPRADTTLDLGIDRYVDQVDSSRRDVRGGVVTRNGPATSVKSRFPDGARSAALGAWAAGTWRATPRLALELSVRWDRAETTLPLADRLSAGRFEADSWTGGAGTLVALSDTLSWASNVRRGFRAPNINDLAQVGRRSNNRIVVANPDLAPETLWSFDTGLRWRSGPWLVEGDVFASRYRDRITLVDTGVTYANGQGGCTRPTGCIESTNRNVARASYHGVEAELRYSGARLAVFANANYTRGEQRSGSVTTPANRIPPLNATLGVDWQWRPAVKLDARATLAGRQDRLDPTDLRDNRINPAGTAGYAVLDATLTWQPREGVELRLMGINLLDRAYRDHGSGIDGMGRALTIGVDLNF